MVDAQSTDLPSGADAAIQAWLGPDCPYRVHNASNFSFVYSNFAGYMSVSRDDSWIIPPGNWARWACPSTLAVDIGAAVGDTSVPIAAAVGRGGAAIAFEFSTAAHLAIVAQSLINEQLHGLHLLPVNLGGSGDDSATGHRRLVHIPTWLQTAVPRLLPHLSFVKIDVDGIDVQILETFAALPQSVRDRLVCKIEWGHPARKKGCGRASESIWTAAAALNLTVFGADGDTEFASCRAAQKMAVHKAGPRQRARRARGTANLLGTFGGGSLFSDLILLPKKIGHPSERSAHCPTPLTPDVLASLPKLPTPA